MKRELVVIQNELLSADYEDTGEFDDALDTFEKGIFDCSLQVRKLLGSQNISTESPLPVSDTKSVKLPRLNVPTFRNNKNGYSPKAKMLANSSGCGNLRS